MQIQTIFRRGGVTLVALALAAFAQPALAEQPLVIEAEKARGSRAKAYQDPRASGHVCTATILDLDHPTGEVFKNRVSTLPASDYTATAWIEVYPVHLLHNFSLVFRAGQASRNYGTVQFDPKPGYQPLVIKFVHPGGPLELSINATGVIGFDGVRHDNSEEEKAAAKSGAGAAGTINLSDKQKKDTEEADGLDLAENPPLSKLTYTDNRVVCDKVEITALRTPDVAVTGVSVDKIHYLPSEKVQAEVKVHGLANGGAYKLVAELISESDSSREVFSKDVTLTAGKIEAIPFEFALDGKTEFGHELRCSLKQGGKTIHDNSAIFGVSNNVYRIGITGNSGPQNKASLTAEQAGKIHDGSKEAYANYFELFAWAPSDFSDMTPDKERWWSGQTMYPGSKTGFKNFFTEAKKRGIKSFSYGSIAGGGIDGYESFRRHPGTVVTSDGVSQLATYFLERSWYGEYSLPLKGTAEGITWQFWSELWSSGSPEAVKLNVDEIVGAAEQIGFDGVRWDFWWVDKMAEVKKMVAERRPDFIWGYNTAFAKPGSPLFLPNQQATSTDFHELAKDHGLIMDESVREWSHTNYSPGTTKPFYDAICREANYVKRIGGMPLFITFDMGSRLDLTFNVLCGLSGGQRYTYMTSPGDFAYGSLPKFLTRFSSFIWDDTAMIADAGKVVGVSVGKGPKGVLPWWDQSVWLRKTPGGPAGKQQLLVNLLNPVGYGAFCNRVQQPPSTLKEVSVSVPVPAGAKVARVFQVSPDLVDGMMVLPMVADGAAVKVVVPELRAWSIVVYELESTGGELAYPAFKLTTPVEDAAAFIKTQDEKKATAEQAKNQEKKVGLVDGEKATTAPAAPEPAPAAAPSNLPIHYQFDKTVNADAPHLKSLPKLADPNVRRDGILDVHHAKGPFSWLNPIEQAAGLCGGGTFDSSYVYRETFKNGSYGYMNDFPDSMPGLLKKDVLVIDNVHAMDIGPLRRVMIAEYVKNGGGLLFFGGYHSLTMGWHHNTALEEVLPVNVTARFQMSYGNKPMPLVPVKKDFFEGNIDWDAKPAAFAVDNSKLKEGAEVLATVNGMPAIVRSTYGKGRVITVLINQHGDNPKDALAYWQWSGYPKLLASCIKWLGEDAGKVVVPKPEPVVINQKEVLPSNLAVEAALLAPAEFTKRLKSAQKNMVDAETARTVLELSIENVDKIEDQELLGMIATMSEAYIDDSFSPLARKLTASPHTVFKRVGLQILGLTGDKTLRAVAENTLTSTEVKLQRAALIAIGRIGDPESMPAVRRYLKGGGTEKLLALSAMRRLGDADALKEALAFFPESKYMQLATKTGRLAQWHKLTSGTSFKMTPAARKAAQFKYELTIEEEQAIGFDHGYFTDSLRKFSDADMKVMIEFFNGVETYRVAPLAYTILSRLPAAQAEQFRAGVAKAVLPEIQALSGK